MEISIIIEIYDRNNTTQIEDTLYLVLQTLYMAIVVYAPALALSQCKYT